MPTALQRRAPPLALALALALPAPAPAADDEKKDKLEPWQQRLLRALEQRQAEEPEDPGRRALRAPGEGDPGAARAAAAAQARFGGRPLAVLPSGDGYRVRLLLDSGRVVTVEIRD